METASNESDRLIITEMNGESHPIPKSMSSLSMFQVCCFRNRETEESGKVGE